MKNTNIIRLNITTFEDLRIYGLKDIFNKLFDFMNEEIIKENTILIERQYSNADPDTIKSIGTIEELNLFKNTFK